MWGAQCSRSVESASPSAVPSEVRTDRPSVGPTLIPSIFPSAYPSRAPTDLPTHHPTHTPSTSPSSVPIPPTHRPSAKRKFACALRSGHACMSSWATTPWLSSSPAECQASCEDANPILRMGCEFDSKHGTCGLTKACDFTNLKLIGSSDPTLWSAPCTSISQKNKSPKRRKPAKSNSATHCALRSHHACISSWIDKPWHSGSAQACQASCEAKKPAAAMGCEYDALHGTCGLTKQCRMIHLGNTGNLWSARCSSGYQQVRTSTPPRSAQGKTRCTLRAGRICVSAWVGVPWRSSSTTHCQASCEAKRPAVMMGCEYDSAHGTCGLTRRCSSAPSKDGAMWSGVCFNRHTELEAQRLELMQSN